MNEARSINISQCKVPSSITISCSAAILSIVASFAPYQWTKMSDRSSFAFVMTAAESSKYSLGSPS